MKFSAIHFKILAILVLAASASAALAQAKDKHKGADEQPLYRYRLYLADKAGSPYSVARPEEFLSQRALERRHRYGISVDEADLPVSPAYLDSLRRIGLKIHNVCKWQNTVVVETADKALVNRACTLPFVKGSRLVWRKPGIPPTDPDPNRKDRIRNRRDTLENYYGYSQQQVEMISANRLHEAGFRGQDMLIGVLDGGFLNVDAISGFNHDNILGTRNFVWPGADVYASEPHGMMVLSCIGANVPHFMVGTAPDARFYLIQTEDSDSEQLVEEDNYCAGVEYADSLGCDIVTASLGYYKFDLKEMNHAYSDLNGITALNSREASMAASRGMILLNSAGNEGEDTWKKIGFPADARDIISVGAVRSDSINTIFSSIGYTADRRIKPDAMAMGENAALYNTRGNASAANGTSFSCPILCGGVACLWQAHRDKSPVEIIEAIHAAGHYAKAPNEVYGYGIPNLWKAHELLGGSRKVEN